MRDFIILFVHLTTTVARLAGPGGIRAVVAESVLVKQRRLILNRSRKRAYGGHRICVCPIGSSPVYADF